MDVKASERIILAYDKSELGFHLDTLRVVAPYVGAVKLGLEAMTAPIGTYDRAPVAFRMLQLARTMRMKVMWDGKYNDIPNTMAKAVGNMAVDRVWGMTIHANAGSGSIRAAVENRGESLIIGVTILTSIGDAECVQMYNHYTTAKVRGFANMLLDAGAQAIVCSPREIDTVRDVAGSKLLIITPGIRDADAPPDDQRRTLSAYDAIARGADYLVIGRPILGARNPVDAAQRIGDQINDALS